MAEGSLPAMKRGDGAPRLTLVGRGVHYAKVRSLLDLAHEVLEAREQLRNPRYGQWLFRKSTKSAKPCTKTAAVRSKKPPASQ
mmetsp:Transcript_12523/g.29404  ORF Transcript_12523/g.29404 Transcript_12523/m.29404 type:complete len:83 (-) Transcript_12523:928-1176(-)